jgi:hypothetical protein
MKCALRGPTNKRFVVSCSKSRLSKSSTNLSFVGLLCGSIYAPSFILLEETYMIFSAKRGAHQKRLRLLRNLNIGTKANSVLPDKLGFRVILTLSISVVLASLASMVFVPGLAQKNDKTIIQSKEASPVGLSVEQAVEVKDDTIQTEDAETPTSADLITATTYLFTASTGVALEDMSSGTTQLVAPSVDDTASAVTNIGFDFWYDGVRHTQFSVNANGLVRLGPLAVSTVFTNSTGFATTTNAPKIAPYFDDLCVGSDGRVHFKVIGSAPNRTLVVEWRNMKITRNGTCTGAVGNGTFQMWLKESIGVIEFVYGDIPAASATDTGYTIGLQSGASTNFASVTTTGNTVSYTVHNSTQINAISAGTKYTFTPNVPATPSGLNFTPVTATGMTLNWTDNATNELIYQILRSTDGVNYTLISQAPANTVTFTDTFLTPSTTYFYRIFAISEGALSAPLSGSQATSGTGSVSSTAMGGNWSDTATWVGGVVPTASDSVTIADNATITIDTAASAFSVTVGSASVLQFEATTARTLSVGGSVTINSNGTFRSATTGTQTGHLLSVAGDITNNGTLDFNTNSDTASATISFVGPNSSTFGGAGATTDVRAITVNKGTSSAPVVELNTSNFTVRDASTDSASANYLTLTNGTFKVSGSFTANLRTFADTPAYTIPATAGFWLNNPNYTVTGQNASATANGMLRVSQGSFNIGTAADNSLGFGTGSTVIVEGGAVNATGRFGVAAAANAITYNQSGGVVTVCTLGNTSTTLASFDVGTSATSSVTITGGSIVVQLASAAATTPRDYRHQSGSAATSNGTASVTGGTLQLGNVASGAARAFNIAGVIPNLNRNIQEWYS